MTLYHTLKEAGVRMANHESDLYFEATPEAIEILDKFPLEKSNATYFRNRVDGNRVWADVPFSYIPWWDSRATAVKS